MADPVELPGEGAVDACGGVGGNVPKNAVAEDAAESFASSYVEVGNLVRIGDGHR